jgi:hypothetical protein
MLKRKEILSHYLDLFLQSLQTVVITNIPLKIAAFASSCAPQSLPGNLQGPSW